MTNVEVKLNELIELLKNQEEVKNFKLIEQKMLDNDYIKSRIDAYKKMQQKVVLYESKQGDLPEEVNGKLERLYDELFDIPLYNEYSSLQEEINEALQQITFILESELNK